MQNEIALLTQLKPVPVSNRDDPLEPINSLLESLFKYKKAEERKILLELKKKADQENCMFKNVPAVLKYFYIVLDGSQVITNITFDQADLVDLGKKDSKPSTLAPPPVKRPHIEGTNSATSSTYQPPIKSQPPLTAALSAIDETERNDIRKVSLERTCKVCMDAPIGVLFVPCGHLVACRGCSAALNACPVCRQKVSGTVGINF